MDNRSSLLIKRESRNDSSVIQADRRSNDDDSVVNQGSFQERDEDEVKLTILRAKELYNESKLNSLLKQDTLSIIKEKCVSNPKQ